MCCVFLCVFNPEEMSFFLIDFLRVENYLACVNRLNFNYLCWFLAFDSLQI